MRILALGDMHFPWIDFKVLMAAHEFAKDYKPDLVIQVGDIVDQKAWSRYPKDVDDPSPHEEWMMAEDGLHALHRLFPKMIILEGNHCRRIMCRALEAGIPKKLIKTLDQVFDFPDWHWHMHPRPYVADGIAFIHGDEMAGNAYQKAGKLGMPLVQGHDHLGYLQFINTFDREIFGMSIGCMIDSESIAARYAAKNALRTWQGWATITDGEPHLHRYRSK